MSAVCVVASRRGRDPPPYDAFVIISLSSAQQGERSSCVTRLFNICQFVKFVICSSDIIAKISMEAPYASARLLQV
jgi:hypothetical protein